MGKKSKHARKKTGKKAMIGERVKEYKGKTNDFKSALETHAGPIFFEKDTVRSFGRAVDFLCQEAKCSDDTLAELILH